MTAVLPPSTGASALFATRRTPSRRTLGPEVCGVMEMLGWSPMPWQRLVLDVAMEVDEKDRPFYRDVTLIVPRQSGKTALLMALHVHRAVMGPDHGWGGKQRSIYTAQARKDAVAKLRDDEMPRLKGSPFAPLVAPRTTTGSEGLVWQNGSLHTVEAPSKKAAHGMTLDLCIHDEAFAAEDDRVEQGARPAMSTRRCAQYWVASAIGDDNDERTSAYLKAKQEVGRAAVAHGRTNRMAYFEWGDEDGDASDPATWRRAHPALGITIDESVIEADFTAMNRPTFERAYLCRWPGAARVDAAIPADPWAACRTEGSTIAGRVAFAVDVALDRASATLAAAWEREDGAVHVELLRSGPGVGWVVDRVVANLAARPDSIVGLDAGSAAGALIPDLERALGDRAKDALALFGHKDVARAAGTMFDLVAARRLRHIGQEALDEAVAASPKRRIGDQWAFAWVPGVDITPLRAASLALWAHVSKPAKRRPDWSRF